MNRYMIVCRLRWPAILLLTGVIALLNQMDLLSWGRAWPLYLILLGVLALAERAALASEPVPPVYPGAYPAGYAPGQPAGFSAAGGAAGPVAQEPAYRPVATSIVPASSAVEIESSDAARQPRKSWDEEGR